MKFYCILFFLAIIQNISAQNFDKLSKLKIYEPVNYDEFNMHEGKVLSSSRFYHHYQDNLNAEISNHTNYTYNNLNKISHIEFKEFNHQKAKYDASFHYIKNKLSLIKLYYSHRENEKSYYKIDIDYNKNNIIAYISEYPDTLSRKKIKIQINLNSNKQIKQIKKTYTIKNSNYNTENLLIQIFNFEYKLGNIENQEMINYSFTEGINDHRFSYQKASYKYDKNKNVLNHLFNENKFEILLYNILFDEFTSYNTLNLNPYNLNLDNYTHFTSKNNVVKRYYTNSLEKDISNYLTNEDLSVISNLSRNQLTNYNLNYNRDKSIKSVEISIENFNSTSEWPENFDNNILYTYEY